ncbi:hypothetical protein P872_24800 [Rhodonellum psychrophilum GCM71 = DSM 17998]|uniref:YdhG-like domain-containing protein n=2 Tax=Rhodonellum TaxID=336827 RepID=U5C489_9BACT|nr:MULTISPECIES: DUF1801 domain-containing protein [Rhodonellum]ERM84639.1 hypothetical protein P872_24800 [Rhodonellum psychrophilum GCM71 = DSM 17998]SDY87281.1 protein of unknown function (DU1801) [Rhodonellum ikkaensis]
MQFEASSIEEYFSIIPEDRVIPMKKLRETILSNLPEGFEEMLNYGMIGFVVPHSLYPAGYHCDPKLPVPFMGIASQKRFIAVYHMGIYADPNLLEWFVGEYPKHSKLKLDMGKSCIRFKKTDQIPYELIGQLSGKMTVQAWIDLYESKLKP